MFLFTHLWMFIFNECEQIMNMDSLISAFYWRKLVFYPFFSNRITVILIIFTTFAVRSYEKSVIYWK